MGQTDDAGKPADSEPRGPIEATLGYTSTPESVERGDWGPDPEADAEEHGIEVERIARSLYIDNHPLKDSKEAAGLWWDREPRSEGDRIWRDEVKAPWRIAAEKQKMGTLDSLREQRANMDALNAKSEANAPVINPGERESDDDLPPDEPTGDGSAKYHNQQIRDRQDSISNEIFGLDGLESQAKWKLNSAVPDGDELSKTQSVDANLWAYAFLRRYGSYFMKHPCHEGGIERLDEVRGWFANAIQGAIDRTRNEIEEQPDRFLAEQEIRNAAERRIRELRRERDHQLAQQHADHENELQETRNALLANHAQDLADVRRDWSDQAAGLTSQIDEARAERAQEVQAVRDEYADIVKNPGDRSRQHEREKADLAERNVELQQLLKDEREKHGEAMRRVVLEREEARARVAAAAEDETAIENRLRDAWKEGHASGSRYPDAPQINSPGFRRLLDEAGSAEIHALITDLSLRLMKRAER